MANAITINSVDRGTKQFQGAFKEMFFVNATITDQNVVNDDTSSIYEFTVPGLELGDMYLGFSVTLSQHDANAGVIVQAYVHSANTVRMQLTNIDATTDAFDADTFNNQTVRLLFGRPNW